MVATYIVISLVLGFSAYVFGKFESYRKTIISLEAQLQEKEKNIHKSKIELEEHQKVISNLTLAVNANVEKAPQEIDGREFLNRIINGEVDIDE